MVFKYSICRGADPDLVGSVFCLPDPYLLFGTLFHRKLFFLLKLFMKMMKNLHVLGIGLVFSP